MKHLASKSSCLLVTAALLLTNSIRCVYGQDRSVECTPCTGLVGQIRYFNPITLEPDHNVTVIDRNPDLTDMQCPAGYQCIVESLNPLASNTGCCNQCGGHQHCPEGTITILEDNIIEHANVCPYGYSCDNEAMVVTPCPVGTICKGNVQLNCTDLRILAKDEFKLGDIHAGTYCEEGTDKMSECPAGYYCPSPEEQIICPKGYYCPQKSYRFDLIRCRMCDEGEEEIQTYYVPILIALAILTFGCMMYFALVKFKYNPKIAANMLLSTRDDERVGKEIEQNETMKIEEMRPRFVNLYEKIMQICDSDPELYSNDVPRKIFPISPKSDEFGKDLNEDFINAEVLFDFLDIDDSFDLTYEELNRLLGLSDTKLKAFVQTMNTFARQPTDYETIDRDTFASYFIETMLLSNNWFPTEEEARALYRDLCDCSPGATTLRVADIYDSRLSEFLSELEINEMIKNLRAADTDKDNPHFITISEEEFIKSYPNVLEALDHAPSKSSARMGVDISFDNLSLEVELSSKKIRILDSLTGRIHGGTMFALMGGSGAGKTSLLNSLCGRASYGKVSGQVYINGNESSIEQMKDTTGFVPQDDIVHAELTVRENLMYAGRFKLPAGTSSREIKDVANKVMASLGLSRVANNLVGDVHRRGISGGEKKRVNIGVELMSKPSILFLDEPTSGLDSASALQVMKSLSHLCDVEKVTIVSVIHQPRSFIFDLFDGLILLSVGGKMVYQGSVQDVIYYFERLGYVLPPGENVADWLIDISAGELLPTQKNKRKSVLGNGVTRMSIITGGLSKFSDFKSRQNNRSSGDNFSSLIRRKSSNLSDHSVSVREQDTLRASTFISHSANRDVTAVARNNLCKFWIHHQLSLEGRELENFKPPKPYDLPPPSQQQTFLKQLFVNIERNFLITFRSKKTKSIDALVLLLAISVMTGLVGVAEFSKDSGGVADVAFEVLAFDDSNEPLLSNFPTIFQPFSAIYLGMLQFYVEIGVVTVVLVSLSISRSIVDKRSEFYREASSGYDINAYMLALNFSTTVELTCLMTLAAFLSFILRSSLTNFFAYFINFFLLGWISSSWVFFLYPIVPSKNLALTVAFWVTFASLLFSGGLEPISYEEVYSDKSSQLFSGFAAPTRFFQEGLLVSEFRCRETQTGFTFEKDDSHQVNRTTDSTLIDALFLAQNDLQNATTYSCEGWYWNVLPLFLVGLFLRMASMALVHVCNRGEQAKAPIWQEMKNKGNFFVLKFIFVVLLIVFAAVVVSLSMI